MTRVIVVDDQTLVRQGICNLLALAENLLVVGEAGDGEEALRAVEQQAPDLLLMDIRMPRMSGVEATRRLRQTHPSLPIILLTTFDDHQLLLDGIRAGARGYLLKDITLEQLISAIQSVMRGDTAFAPALTERISRSLGATPAGFDSLPQPDALTAREREILRLLAKGCSNREIANVFALTEGTVKNHVSNILGKLGVRDRMQAVIKGADAGLI